MTTDIDTNRQLVMTLWKDLEAAHDVRTVIERGLHPDYRRTSGTAEQTRDEWIDTVQALYTAFPDLQTETTVTIAEGDWVAYKWTSIGHHTGTYYGIPATGKEVRATGITLNRFVDGSIIEEHSSWNKVDVMHTLGILPIAELS